MAKGKKTKRTKTLLHVDISTGTVLESHLESFYYQNQIGLERFEAQPGLATGKAVKERLVAGGALS